MLHDLRFAMRMLVRTPAFTLAAITTLAIGIGANAAIFSVVYAILLRPLPFDRPDQGSAGTWLLTSTIRSLLYDVSPGDPAILAAAGAGAFLLATFGAADSGAAGDAGGSINRAAGGMKIERRDR